MGIKSWICSAIIVVVVAICVTFVFNEKLFVPRYHPSIYPKPTRKYWGKDQNGMNKDNNKQSTLDSFVPYEAGPSQLDKEGILNGFINLWLKREETNPFQHDKFIRDDYNMLTRIKGSGYGINYNDFYNLVEYYNNTFNWDKYKKIIQSFNHNIVNIRGINIHFIRHKLNTNKPKNSINAILLLHGWPSSFWEFNRVLKLFEDQYKQDRIDIIIASLPGYGLSEYPMYHSGFTTAAIAEIFRDLMEKHLSYDAYIVVGGDWGSVIAHNLAYDVAQDNSNKLKGILLSMSISSPPIHELILLSLNKDIIHRFFANKYNVSVERVKHLYSPIYDQLIYKMWDLVGYQHEHATRANTIGIALQSSPISHLAWIYEKYLSWSDSFNKETYDDKKKRRIISGELSWDDILVTNNIFYLNGKISSAIRYYTESLWNVYQHMPFILMPNNIQVGILHYDGDPFDFGFFDKWNYENIVLHKHHDKGGHFPALEYPQIFYNDILEFMRMLQ